MTDRTAAKQRTEQLKRLRGEHVESVARTQALLKEQQTFRRALTKSMKAGAMTIPQIATAAGLPAPEVLWHVAAMKKYDLIREIGKDGDYYQYELVKESSL